MPSSEPFIIEDVAPGIQKFTPNSIWASNTPTGVEEELTLPSGQTCRAKKMSIESVIATGLLADVDILTAVVDKHTRQVKGGNKVPDGPVVQDSLLRDAESLQAIIGLADRLMPHIIVSPKVLPHWKEKVIGKTKVTKLIPMEERESGQVYTDQINLDDKMELFNWSMGGLESFSSFRRESAQDVGDLGTRKGSKNKAKRRPRNT